MTLTTSNLCLNLKGYFSNTDLTNDCKRLIQIIRRLTPYKIYKLGYLTKRQLPHLYNRNDLNKHFNFEYFKVNTNEGNGVIHLVARNEYIPYNLLVDIWNDVHLTWDLNIQKVDTENKKSCKNSAWYIVNQYIANQGSSYTRSSMSKNWIFPHSSYYWKVYLDCSKDWNKSYLNEWGCDTAPIRLDLAIKNFKAYLESYCIRQHRLDVCY